MRATACDHPAPMDPLAVVARLAQIAPRAAGSDGERRAAVWLRDELRARGREASLETIWVRPRWELAAALGITLALAGSIVSIWHAAAGLAVLGTAFLALAGEVSGRMRLLRRLLPERATQNVVSPPRSAAPTAAGRIRLVVTANVDAGRCGSIYADRWRGLHARLRALARGHLSAPLAAIVADVAALVAIAALRLSGTSGAGLSTVQFALIVPLVVALAALLDVALADVSPGANVNASGVAVAMALIVALEQTALRRLDVSLVLAGAGDHDALGFGSFVSSRRHAWRSTDTIVLALEPCGTGSARWLERDGALAGLRFHPRLRAAMATVASEERHLKARPLRAHGTSGAYPARRAGWPAIAVGCFDDLGRVPRALQSGDVADAVDPVALETALELCLAFVGRLDAELAADAPPPAYDAAARASA
jgi:hypothetical protein